MAKTTTARTVGTQAELDAALADPDVTTIEIRSERGVWLTIGETGDTDVTVAGESTVSTCSGRVDRVTGSGRVDRVTGSGRVGEVTGSGRVGVVTGSGSVGVVTGSGRVGEVTGSGRVGEVTGSGSVGEVTGSGSVGEVTGSGSVDRVTGSGRVGEVTGSGRVGEVTGSGRVGEVTGSGSVDWVTGSGSVERAAGTATVHLHGRSTLRRAGSHVAVYLHSAHATVDGGQIIDLTTLDLGERHTWLDHHAVETVTPDSGPLAGTDVAVLYKAVRDDLRSSRGFAYPLGELVACDDWADTDECGAGLHLSPSPREARDYDRHATRYLACHVPLAGLRPLPGGGAPFGAVFGAAKAKTPRVLAVHEVDIHGAPVAYRDAIAAAGVSS